ncbi:unnamed protein product [Ceratitis capitata]|uniref:(Mediterranean fruit fly) hypothetical protein n=1 Tax=Ceratitis capitata TaxID=7213 RepID=A0A811V112_CERCA|nr:unnamed protein product [Ceratitis capitata]
MVLTKWKTSPEYDNTITHIYVIYIEVAVSIAARQTSTHSVTLVLHTFDISKSLFHRTMHLSQQVSNLFAFSLPLVRLIFSSSVFSTVHYLPAALEMTLKVESKNLETLCDEYDNMEKLLSHFKSFYIPFFHYFLLYFSRFVTSVLKLFNHFEPGGWTKSK